MAKAPTKKRRSSADVAEERVRALRARLESQQLKAALSYYTAAGRSRKDRDWRPNPASADLALIPEMGTIVARSRAAIANTWVGKAAKRAQVRNIIGRGITIVPTARGESGEDLAELNEEVAADFAGWASDQGAVDVEGRRTLWQIQRAVISEEFAAGQAFIVWSYEPHPRRCGLRLQLVEHEQLDMTLQSYGPNEVRGGIEIDHNGRPVAYHFYERNPNDYLSRAKATSARIPAERVIHYFEAERSQQTHGEPALAPVLQDIRNLYALHDATLWRARMEACIGLIVTKNQPTGSGFPFTTPYKSGDTGTTGSGARTADFRPGMVFEARDGESVSGMPQVTPGATYAPFTEQTLRGIGAGIGQSFGALTRHNDGNYSAARQDMLEDEREIGPKQDSFIDRVCLAVWELYYTMSVAENRFRNLDVNEFYDSPDRFMEAEFIPPSRPWIDPEKEVNAYEKAIALHISTRSEIVAMKGGRLQNVLKQRAAEREMAKALQITYAEEASVMQTKADTAASFAKADSDRASAEATKIGATAPPAGLPSPETATVGTTSGDGTPTNVEAVARDLALNGAQITAAIDVMVKVRQGILIEVAAIELLASVGIPRDKAEQLIAATVKAPPLVPDQSAVESLTAKGVSRADAHEIVANQLASQAAPKYRRSLDQLGCATCSNAVGMACGKFDFNFEPNHTCDAWTARPISETEESGRSIQPAGRREGDEPIDTASSHDGRES